MPSHKAGKNIKDKSPASQSAKIPEFGQEKPDKHALRMLEDTLSSTSALLGLLWAKLEEVRREYTDPNNPSYLPKVDADQAGIYRLVSDAQENLNSCRDKVFAFVRDLPPAAPSALKADCLAEARQTLTLAVN